MTNPDLRQGIICCVAFGHSSLRRIVVYVSLVAPRCLAFNALPEIMIPPQPLAFTHAEEIRRRIWGNPEKLKANEITSNEMSFRTPAPSSTEIFLE